MPLNGQLLVGVALAPNGADTIETTLAGYRTASYRRLILAPLEHLGVADAGRLNIAWDESSRSVVGHFTFDRSVSVAGTQVRFERGDRAQLFNSHRFTEPELARLLNDTGFGDVRFAKSRSFPYALAGARVSGTGAVPR